MRYFAIHLLIVVVLFIRIFMSTYEVSRGGYMLNQANDTESLFAFGNKLSFSRSDVYSLELIPGISDLIANRLLKMKGAIIQKSQGLKSNVKHTSFTQVYGIGIKTAEKLAIYLLL